jgi:hypothetical protein
MKIELTQDGLMSGSCVVWGGSIQNFMDSYREGEWEVLLVDTDRCDFINAPDDTDNYLPPYIELRWDRGIECPPGEYLDDNWWIVEKFIEKDSCKVCNENEYRAGFGEEVSSVPPLPPRERSEREKELAAAAPEQCARAQTTPFSCARFARARAHLLSLALA